MPENDHARVLRLLRALQLSSPSLPIGAYAYSQGAEYAVHAGYIVDEASAGQWLLGLLAEALPQVDLPLLRLSYGAFAAGDLSGATRYSQMLLACRESAELQAEERHLGTALARVLSALGCIQARVWTAHDDATYVGAFALGSVYYAVPIRDCLSAYAFAWLEHQVSAVTRLVPLGQLAAQRILDAGIRLVPRSLDASESVSEKEIGFVGPALQIASARHETQYTRLFRS